MTRRPATADDADFAYLVLESSMRGYVEQTWGRWMESEVRAQTSGDANTGASEVIECDGQPIGLMKVVDSDTRLYLDQLYLLPPYQRRGIGSRLVEELLDRARARGLPVRLRVLRVNPAKALYERHGFFVTSEEPERFHMESGDLGFTHRLRKGGEVELLHRGRLAATLRGTEAQDFRSEVGACTLAQGQQLMARLTGNYKHGNERVASRHPRYRR